MEMLQNAVNWVEIPVSDFNRAKSFYSSIYDFEMPEMMMGPQRMGFLLFDQEKGVGCAIVQGETYIPSAQGVKLYLNGGLDLNTVLNRVPAAGGKIVLSKTAIGSGLGYMAAFQDPEGNHIHLHSVN
jgi:predicted enzyme related to lactoylglutathione lyase